MRMNRKKQNVFCLVMLFIVFGASLYFWGTGVYYDTKSYEVMSPMREPGYGVLLYGFRAIFGEQHVYMAVAVLQNILAVAVCYVVLTYLIEEFAIQAVMEKVILFAAMLLPYIVTPVFTVTHMVIANAILTEGITLSLYNLYFYFLLRLVWNKQQGQKKYLIYSCASLFISLVLVLLRGQMLVTLIAWGIVQACLLLRSFLCDRQPFSQILKKMIFCIALMCLATGIRFFSVGMYNYVNNGTFASTPYSKVTVFTNVLYVSNRDAGEKIEDQTLKSLYYAIYDEAESQKVLYINAPQGLKEEADFFSSAHDILKMDIIEGKLTEYIEDTYGNISYLNRLIIMDQMSGKMMKATIGDCLTTYILHYFRNVLVGLIRSVAVLHPLLYLPVLGGYLLLIILGVYLGIKNKDSKEFKFFLLTALLTAGMVGAVSLTIMCLSRYMIYNTSLIYMCGILMFRESIQVRRKEKQYGL